MRRSLTAVAAIVAASLPLLAAQHAHAAACTGTLPITGSSNDLSLDINGTTYHPVSCIEDTVFSPPFDPDSEKTKLNNAFGTNFGLMAQWSTDGGALSYTVDGLTFTVAESGTKSGAWTVTWADANGAAPANLPVSIDFEVGLTGGSNGAGYLFHDVVLPNGPFSGTGTFDITFRNNGGQIPGIASLVLIGGDIAPVDAPGNPIPEPSSIALMGLGMIALGTVRFVRRRTPPMAA